MQRPLNTTPLNLLDGIACLDIEAGELRSAHAFRQGTFQSEPIREPLLTQNRYYKENL